MATFSTNETRQIIVANAFSAAGTAPGTVIGAKAFDNKFFIEFINANGQKVKSDYIDINKIRSAKVVSYAPHMLRQDEISMEQDNVVAGQSYIVRILFRGWGSGSAEDQYFKFLGAYKAKAGDTPEDVFNALVKSGIQNFAREDADLLDFKVEGTGATAKMIVTEKPQEWVLGKKQGRPLDYTIQFVPINLGNGAGETAEWATITNISGGMLGMGTGTLAADMEYFFLGERGDIYRQVGFPYTWNTKYLVDVNATYDAIEIAYFFSDEAHAVQASEKQLVILCKRGSTNITEVSDDIVDAINAAAGSDILSKLVVDKVIVVGGIGTASNASITALTSGTTYQVVVNPNEVGEKLMYVKSAGTLSETSPSQALTGTAITGLTNGTRYKVITVA